MNLFVNVSNCSDYVISQVYFLNTMVLICTHRITQICIYLLNENLIVVQKTHFSIFFPSCNEEFTYSRNFGQTAINLSLILSQKKKEEKYVALKNLLT